MTAIIDISLIWVLWCLIMFCFLPERVDILFCRHLLRERDAGDEGNETNNDDSFH
jgi:hypothetical protein